MKAERMTNNLAIVPRLHVGCAAWARCASRGASRIAAHGLGGCWGPLSGHEDWSSHKTWVSWCVMRENNSRQVKSEKWNLRRIGRNAHVCASVFTLRDHSDTWDRAPEPPGALGSVNVQGRS